jgi:hypothetical protein
MDLFLVRGPKRSGNHLFVNWLTAFYKTSFFGNNCCPKSFQTKDQVIEAISQQLDDVVIFSFEVPQYFSQKEINAILVSCKSYQRVHAPFIIRDPLNWMASMLYKQSVPPTGKQVSGDYAKNSKKYWDFWLQCFKLWEKSPMRVDFNKFVASKQYRKDIAAKMGLKFNLRSDDKILNTLWMHKDVNPPSSFDTQAVQLSEIQPKEMRVLERYKKVLHIFEKYGIPAIITEKASQHWGVP